MYLISSGVVEVWSAEGMLVTTLTSGAYFGEVSLLLDDVVRTANIVARTYCNLLLLSREHLNDLLKHYPEYRDAMYEIAVARQNKLNEFKSGYVPAPARGGYDYELEEIGDDEG